MSIRHVIKLEVCKVCGKYVHENEASSQRESALRRWKNKVKEHMQEKMLAACKEAVLEYWSGGPCLFEKVKGMKWPNKLPDPTFHTLLPCWITLGGVLACTSHKYHATKLALTTSWGASPHCEGHRWWLWRQHHCWSLVHWRQSCHTGPAIKTAV